MRDKAQKQALALVYGVMMTTSLIYGIPGGVPGLSRTLSCATCKVELSKVVPTKFAPYMTEEQKAAFRKEYKRLKKKVK